MGRGGRLSARVNAQIQILHISITLRAIFECRGDVRSAIAPGTPLLLPCTFINVFLLNSNNSFLSR